MNFNDMNLNYEDLILPEPIKLNGLQRFVLKILGLDSVIKNYIVQTTNAKLEDLLSQNKEATEQLQLANSNHAQLRSDIATLYSELRSDVNYFSKKIDKIKPVINAEGEVKEVIKSYLKKFDDGFNTNQRSLEEMQSSVRNSVSLIKETMENLNPENKERKALNHLVENLILNAEQVKRDNP